MPATTIGPASAVPYSTYPTLVQTRKHWSDDWKSEPGLYLESCTRNAGGHDLDSCTLLWKYGHLAHPWESAKQQVAPLDLTGYWVQVLLLAGRQQQTIWVGRVYGQGKILEGVQNGGPSGQQRWQCYGPQMVLRKQMVSRSLWVPPATDPPPGQNWCSWLPPMNDRLGQQAWIVGNRSSDLYSGKSYVYGGAALWSAYDYVTYLLAWFCDFSSATPAGPTFVLGGQADVLKKNQVCEEWPATISVDAMLRKLIAPKLGLDFSIEYSGGQNFTIKVFSLQSQAVAAGGVTLPANPNTVTVQAGQTPANLSTHVAISDDHRVSKIRVLGKRVVLCGTVSGPSASGAWTGGALQFGWDDGALQTDYNNGAGPVPNDATGLKQYPAGSAQAFDYARRNPRYRDVYTLYLSPKDFDLESVYLAIGLDAQGNPSLTPGGNPPARQNFLRKTLRWLPLLANYDYSSWPPTALTETTDTDYAPQFLPPQVYLWSATEKYRVAERCGVHVAVPKQGLGIRLHCHPNHLVAKDTFPGVTLHQPRWAAEEMVATLAWEADCRLALEYDVPNADPVDGIEEILINDAEMWVLANSTALGVNPSHADQLVASPNQLEILRDDRPRLALVLAGAIARYSAGRARAEIVAAGICPWGGLLGQILTTIESGGDSTTVQAPITQITWQNAMDGGLPRTIVRTGFASSE